MAKSILMRFGLGAVLVLAGFVAREAISPREAKAQFRQGQDEQVKSYEVTYEGNDGVWTTERFDRCLYAVEAGALVMSNPYTNELFKAYSTDTWISVREIAP